MTHIGTNGLSYEHIFICMVIFIKSNHLTYTMYIYIRIYTQWEQNLLKYKHRYSAVFSVSFGGMLHSYIEYVYIYTHI